MSDRSASQGEYQGEGAGAMPAATPSLVSAAPTGPPTDHRGFRGPAQGRRQSGTPLSVTKCMAEAGVKMRASSLIVTRALVYFHRFQRSPSAGLLDPLVLHWHLMMTRPLIAIVLRSSLYFQSSRVCSSLVHQPSTWRPRFAAVSVSCVAR